MKGTTTVAARSEANRMPKSRVAQRLVRAAAVIKPAPARTASFCRSASSCSRAARS